LHKQEAGAEKEQVPSTHTGTEAHIEQVAHWESQ